MGLAGGENTYVDLFGPLLLSKSSKVFCLTLDLTLFTFSGRGVQHSKYLNQGRTFLFVQNLRFTAPPDSSCGAWTTRCDDSTWGFRSHGDSSFVSTIECTDRFTGETV